jgi:hypothetical protein
VLNYLTKKWLSQVDAHYQIELFLDKDSLKEGQQSHLVIDSNLLLNQMAPLDNISHKKVKLNYMIVEKDHNIKTNP